MFLEFLECFNVCVMFSECDSFENDCYDNELVKFYLYGCNVMVSFKHSLRPFGSDELSNK